MHNSQYKRFPIGISYGARVFICDNLSFIGYHVIRRKHTVNAKRDLPRLVGQLGSLSEQREVQHRRFESYRQTPLTDERTDYAILSLYREGVLNIERIAEVVGKWESPSFAYEAYVERPAWQLFNAATFALHGRVIENSGRTPRLHKVIDGVCETVY